MRLPGEDLMDIKRLSVILLFMMLPGCIVVQGVETSTVEERAKVIRGVDGDTLALDTGEKVRLLGINTPEKWESFYKEAGHALAELAVNKTVLLTKDVSERDKYGRLLRYVYLENGTFVNRELVRMGWARAYHYPPDTGHYDEFFVLQEEAKAAGLGIWNLTGLESIVQDAYPVGCNFVASKNGETYYASSCKYSHRILPENRVCFATVDEAIAAGYRETAKC